MARRTKGRGRSAQELRALRRKYGLGEFKKKSGARRRSRASTRRRASQGQSEPWA